jgi:hypothetical protein
MRSNNEGVAIMLKIINTLIVLIVLSTIGYSQEIECQNGRCDVVRKVATVAVAPVVVAANVVEATAENVKTVACKVKEKRVPLLQRFRKLCCK